MPVPLFAMRIVGGAVGDTAFKHQYAVALDGRFLISQNVEEATPPITLILNWKP